MKVEVRNGRFAAAILCMLLCGCFKARTHYATAPGGHAIAIYASGGLSKTTYTFTYEKANRPPRELMNLVDDASAGLFIVAWSHNPELVIVKACDMRRPVVRGVRLTDGIDVPITEATAMMRTAMAEAYGLSPQSTKDSDFLCSIDIYQKHSGSYDVLHQVNGRWRRRGD